MNNATALVAIDTNVLLYAQGAGDSADPRRQQALACLERLPMLALPVQVLGEFHRVLRCKFRLAAASAQDAVTAGRPSTRR